MLSELTLAALAGPALLVTGYLFVLTLCSARRRPASGVEPRLRFEVVVPAHDEERGIARTVESLRAMDWPAELFAVTVVADNCTDATAERAAAAGADVMVRNDAARRGKGHALEAAFERGVARGLADAFVVVDADTLVTPNLLAAFASCLEAGALAAQAENTVLNRDASWRTRLMALAFALFNVVRSLGRERLGFSCGLRGNGMCLSRAALLRVPHRAYSVVEDLEYGIRLGEAGIRVAYAGEASVLSEMVTGEVASRSQRRRWEGGRLELARRRGVSLLAEAFRRRSPLLMEMALDLLVPPLSWVVSYVALGTAGAALTAAVGRPAMPLIAWLVACAFVCVYVLRGVQLSGMGLRGLVALLWAPAYVAWKVALLAKSPAERSREWVRTARERRSNADARR